MALVDEDVFEQHRYQHLVFRQQDAPRRGGWRWQGSRGRRHAPRPAATMDEPPIGSAAPKRPHRTRHDRNAVIVSEVMASP
jgi:hypothetical protein